ncbi:MAG: hypothetical protein J3K34DRAFT_520136 [Monoraphidium minutum]|nr:MAG: hypothetical protein J3K34DRAFT_520136 [Monoraphidium minutum]
MISSDRGAGRLAGLMLLAALACASAEPTVHVVFGNHLDVGFWLEERGTGLDSAVLSAYFNEFLPRAALLADLVRVMGAWDPGQRYVYTTHAWLLDMFLHCPPGLGVACPDAFTRRLVDAAIRQGDITWHAHPHNAQYEFYPNAWTFSAAFGLTRRLERRFGQPNTTTAILRDVPGITRAAIPLMREAGVRSLSIGVNTGSAPPGVPLLTPFLWRDATSGAQLLTYVHPGGYGGISRPYPGAADVFLDPPGQCIAAPGLEDVLCTSWRNDNTGPPTSVFEVFTIFQMLRNSFPGHKVVASSFDAFSDAVWRASEEGRVRLPVVTGEIGDTWIHGVQSDPRKTARFRAVARAAAACAGDAACASEGPAWEDFTRLLLKVPEHTWGADVKNTLHDTSNYNNDAFKACATGPASCPNYQELVTSWRRQAAYIDHALAALPPSHPVAAAAAADDAARGSAAAGMSAAAVAARGARRVALDRGGRYRFECGRWELEVDADSGALSRFAYHGRRGPGRPAAATDWAHGRGAAFGQPLYSAYSEASYDVIWSTYAYQSNISWWFYQDFGKARTNLSASWDEEATVAGKLDGLWYANATAGELLGGGGAAGGSVGGGGLQLWLRYSWPRRMVEGAGAPRETWHHYDDGIRLTVAWRGKPPSRVPEALWLRFTPGWGADAASWRLDKLGSPIDPREVIRNGSRSLHAVGDAGASVAAAARRRRGAAGGGYSYARDVLRVASLDAALVSPGRPRGLPNVVVSPEMAEGVSFNLANNLWGTNYVMWTPWEPADADMAFRFELSVQEEEEGEGEEGQGEEGQEEEGEEEDEGGETAAAAAAVAAAAAAAA